MVKSLRILFIALVAMTGCSGQSCSRQDPGGGDGIAPAPPGSPSAQTAEAPPAGRLGIEARGFRNREGRCLASLFDSPEGFPRDSKKAVQRRAVDLASDSVVVWFEDLSPGTYAVSVLHDENGDGKLDRGFFGVPKEGYGVSNNPPPGFRAPAYEDARFEFSGGEMRLRVQVNYYGSEPAGARSGGDGADRP